MCGFGDRTCGICASAGFCICSMNEDEFSPASKEEVRKRLEEGRYPSDIEVMKAFLGISDRGGEDIKIE